MDQRCHQQPSLRVIVLRDAAERGQAESVRKDGLPEANRAAIGRGRLYPAIQSRWESCWPEAPCQPVVPVERLREALLPPQRLEETRTLLTAGCGLGSEPRGPAGRRGHGCCPSDSVLLGR